jgi:hypothetical protein
MFSIASLPPTPPPPPQCSGIFLGVALLRTAKISVGCEVSCEGADCPEDPIELADCNEKVFGFKPSSLLAVMGMIVGLLAAITMPVIGAIVDHTSYRWKIGAVSGFLLVLKKNSRKKRVWPRSTPHPVLHRYCPVGEGARDARRGP